MVCVFRKYTFTQCTRERGVKRGENKSTTSTAHTVHVTTGGVHTTRTTTVHNRCGTGRLLRHECTQLPRSEATDERANSKRTAPSQQQHHAATSRQTAGEREPPRGHTARGADGRGHFTGPDTRRRRGRGGGAR